MTRAPAHTPRHRLTFLWVALVVLSSLFTAGLVTDTADAAVVKKVQRVKKSQTDFRVSSFNLLGYDHTRNGRRGMRDGRTRTNYALQFLDMWQIDVVGFQEFQPEQRERFMELTGSSWGHYPGFELPRPAVHNSIAWRTDHWTLVESHAIGIPYFRGREVLMPYILLEHKVTGKRVWFANFHNPANSKGPAQKWRDIAREREVVLANALQDKTGHPVVFTGDFNERETFFCKFTRDARMKAANGGSYGNTSQCVMPPRETRPGIDWIFGSLDLQFSNYARRQGSLVKKITDHPVIVTDVTLPGRWKRR